MRRSVPAAALTCLLLFALRPAWSIADPVPPPSVRPADLSHVVEGSGPTLVIVHGGWGDQRSFSGASPILAQGSTVVRVSLRLHWPNPWPASEQEAIASYRAQVHVADLVALIERLGRAPVDLMGHSYGGAIAALLAQSRPDLIRKLILVEPALYSLWPSCPGGEEYVQGLAASRAKMRAKIEAGQDPLAILRAMYDDDRPGTFDSFPEWRRQILIDNARTTEPLFKNSLLSEPFGCAEAKQMKMPVLLVEGEKTSPGMRAIDTKLLECLPDSRRAVLPGVGHTIQFGAPEVMAVVVADFLRR
jgi:pimeloyl-ACP methyl ester carboxylesterase